MDLGKRDFNENEISARRSQIGDFLNGINNLVSNLDKIKEILLIAAGGVINGNIDYYIVNLLCLFKLFN